MQRKLNSLRLIGLLAVCGLVFSMCDRKPPLPSSDKVINYDGLRDSLHAMTDSFSPIIGDVRHKVLRLLIEDEEVVPPTDTSSLILRFGAMPRMNSPGSLHVLFFNGNMKLVDDYYMRNPLYHRLEFGPGRGLKRVAKGSFYIPVPDGPSVAWVQIWENDYSEGDSTLVLDNTDISFIH